MAFNSYKNIGDVVKEFKLIYTEEDYIVISEQVIGDYFRNELEFNLKEVSFDNSEYAVCENLIYPLLKEVWKSYKDDFMLWSHQPLKYDDNLFGVPDYIIAKRSPQGKVVFDKPYFVVVEAKKDKFSEGWGQCLAEAIAMQRINDNPSETLFGSVSNGKIWEFGKLNLDVFKKNTKSYTIENLDQLFAAIKYVFDQCKLQLVNDV